MTLSPKHPAIVAPLDTSPFPLSLSLVKAHLREDSSDFDTIIESYMRAAIAWAENITHRTIYDRAVSWVLNDFPRDVSSGEIWLPQGLCGEVTSIQYRDNAGILQTLRGPSSPVSPAGDDWQEAILADTGAYLYPAVDDGGNWPAVDTRYAMPVVINYRAGWQASSVPDDVVHALLFAVADLYDTSSSADLTVFGKNLQTRTSLISPYIINRWY
jgi:hypothetical protein